MQPRRGTEVDRFKGVGIKKKGGGVGIEEKRGMENDPWGYSLSKLGN